MVEVIENTFCRFIINMKTRNSLRSSKSPSQDQKKKNGKLQRRRRSSTTTSKCDGDDILSHCSSRQRRGQRRTSDAEFPFQNLPTECQVKIFSFLSDAERCRCASLCRSWAQLMRTPRLWTNADFKQLFLSIQSDGVSTLAGPNLCDYMSMKQKIQDYVNHLVSRKAFLKKLTFDFDLLEGDEIWLKLLIRCLNETNSRELESAMFDWHHTSSPYSFMISNAVSPKSSQILCFHKFLKALHQACPNVASIAMPFDWSPLSIHLLSQFQSVTSLELSKYWVFRAPNQSAIDKLLNHFPNLTRLKMAVAVRNKQFEAYPQYTIRSASLQELDIRYSSGFFLWSVNLPQLLVFRTRRGSWCGPMIDRDHLKIPCLYTVLQSGAPKLRMFNDTELDKDWKLACRPEFELALKASCFCKRHKKGALIY